MCWWGRAIGAGLSRSPRHRQAYIGRLRLRGRLGPGSVCWCCSTGSAPRWGIGEKRGKGKRWIEGKGRDREKRGKGWLLSGEAEKARRKMRVDNKVLTKNNTVDRLWLRPEASWKEMMMCEAQGKVGDVKEEGDEERVREWGHIL